MKEKINKNIESQNRDVKNYKPIRIRFKRSSRYKPGYIKSRNFIIRHPWYNKKRQLTTLPSGIIYNIFDKNTSFHNPPLPSSTQLPIEKYNMEKLLSLGYSSVKAQELTWLLKFHSRFIRKEQYKYKRAFESIQKVNILEKEGYKHWTVRRDERIKAEALKNKNIIENKNKNIIENKKENINTNIRESIKNKNIIENKAEVYSHTSNIPIEKQNTKKALTANTIKVDKSDNNLNKFINNSNKSPIYIYNPMYNNNRSQSAPIKQMPLKKDPFSLAFKSFVHSLIWKRNNAVTFSSLALDMKFKKLFTTLGMKKRFHKPSTLFKVLRHSRLYKSLLGYLRDSIKSNNNKLANLCRLSIIKFLSH